MKNTKKQKNYGRGLKILNKKCKGLRVIVETKYDEEKREKKMVTEIRDRVTPREFIELSQSQREVTEQKGNNKVDESGNAVVVSKDFILNLLSLAIGKPFFLEGNLGKKVDVKI